MLSHVKSPTSMISPVEFQWNFFADFHPPKKKGGLEVVVEARSAFAGAAMGRSLGNMMIWYDYDDIGL